RWPVAHCPSAEIKRCPGCPCRLPDSFSRRHRENNRNRRPANQSCQAMTRETGAIEMTSRRAIPAVGRVLEALGDSLDIPRPVVTDLVRQKLASLRGGAGIPSFNEIVTDLQAQLTQLSRSRLQPVINGTGIVLHTNFGRAPLAPAAVRRVT